MILELHFGPSALPFPSPSSLPPPPPLFFERRRGETKTGSCSCSADGETSCPRFRGWDHRVECWGSPLGIWVPYNHLDQGHPSQCNILRWYLLCYNNYNYHLQLINSKTSHYKAGGLISPFHAEPVDRVIKWTKDTVDYYHKRFLSDPACNYVFPLPSFELFVRPNPEPASWYITLFL